jgi:hypothetical protein
VIYWKKIVQDWQEDVRDPDQDEEVSEENLRRDRYQED